MIIWCKLILFAIIFNIGSNIMGQPEKEKPLTSGSVYGLSSTDIKYFSIEAMRGNSEVALKLAQYYRYSINDEKEAYKWELIGAENGNIISQHNTAYDLLYHNKNDLRGIYWLRIAAENGDQAARNRLLNQLGLTLDLDLKDDSFFYLKYENMSEDLFEDCIRDALQGNGKPALILANYYQRTNDMVNTEYWYRIGAQNGNDECKYKLGLILSGKPELLDKERGKYWLNYAGLKK
jgi:TPR repeat protein